MVAAIETTKLLVAVKTYPSLSNHYNEVVCTAGIRADGTWVRLYPVQYRALPKPQRFRKYQWIEVSLCRDPKDPRPESHKLDGAIQPLQWLNTKNNWATRKEVLLQNVHYDLNTVISIARDIRSFQSLFVFKPTKMLQFKVHRCDHFDYLDRKREAIIHRLPDTADLVDYTPYKFFYSFSDIKGKESTLRIIDWEISIG